MTIASRDYTTTQQDASTTENQQQAKQLLEHIKENHTKTNIPEKKCFLVCQSSTIKPPPPPSKIHAVSSLASNSSFPMHHYKFHVPKIIKSPPSLSPFFQRV